MKNFLLGSVLMLILAGIVGGAYYLGKSAPLTNNPSNPSVSPTSIQATPEISPSVTPTITIPVVSDDELIKQALYKKNNWPEGSMAVKVSTNDGKYASGTASSSGGGGYFYAAKVNGVWEIVADGNGMILCSSLTKYPDFPKTLISECYDQSSGKTVKR